MKQIYLVRHCKYSNPRNILSGRLPVELSEEGLKQTGKLADFFSNKKIEKIYSSAVVRCKQTSEIISKGKIFIEFDKRLLETFSAYQGFWFDEGKELDWSHFFSHRDKLGGESLLQIQKRMLSFFNDLVKKKEKSIIVCSHGDPLYVLYLALANKPLIDDEASLDEITEYQPTASIREIKWINKGNIGILPIVGL